jgi:hypothetical protein
VGEIKRPAETLTAAIASILGALFIVLGAVDDGFEGLRSPEVQGAIVILVGWIAAAVTWYVAKRQRAGELKSATDGTVRGDVV